MQCSVSVFTIATVVIFTLILPQSIDGALKRCFSCRSRGELGSCKDPFLFKNASSVEGVAGVEAVPCASGWCGKILEGGANSFKDEEYGMATERLCLQRGLADDKERCAPTVVGHTKVMMCFCQGDLCNSASVSSISPFILMLALTAVAFNIVSCFR